MKDTKIDDVCRAGIVAAFAAAILNDALDSVEAARDVWRDQGTADARKRLDDAEAYAKEVSADARQVYANLRRAERKAKAEAKLAAAARAAAYSAKYKASREGTK